MKKCGLSIDFAKLISKKSDKYDEVSFEADWDSYNESQITSTEGTLRHTRRRVMKRNMKH